jgi:uncharacterized coiled-coil DUF342 family protein
MSSQPGSNPSELDPANASSPRRPAGLSKEVQTLTTVIKQLEEQLDQMMVTNEALRKDLHDDRARRLALEEKVDELHEQLRRSERQAADRDNLLAEVKHLNHERARLASSARALGDQYKELLEKQKADAKRTEQLRAAHTDAVDEVQSVEAQFENAMQVIAQLRTQLSVACEERDQQIARAKNTERQLEDVREERDVVVAEVEQSRAALDEIRQSLLDQVVGSRDDDPRNVAAQGAR